MNPQPPAPEDEQVITGIPNPQNIDMGELTDEWKQSKAYVENYTRDFKYLDDLVDGITLNHEKNAPFVGDTTLAGLVRSIPKNSLQQLPVFSARVNGTKNSVPALLCTFLLKKTAFNEDTFGKGLLSTLQIGAEQALSHGYAPFMVATGTMYEDFGTTLRLLHFSDTAPERGISDSNESGFHYVVANLTKTRVKKILRAAKNNPNTTWNIPALEELLQAEPQPKTYSLYESSAKQNQPGEQSGPTYEFVTRYETGQGGTVITFSPQMTEAPLRVLETKSKWGYPRVMYLVIDPAALTPFGVSRVRLASPNQNLLNIYYAQIAAVLLLNSKPPIFKKGRFTSPVELVRGSVWATNDNNADAKMMNMDNGALEQFVEMQAQFASQIQNIIGGQTAALPAGTKNGFGKTGPGVKASTDLQDVNTNQITKILENFLRQYALVALDTLLSEQEGKDNIIIDDETKNAINTLKPGTVGDDNKIEMDWQRFYQSIEDWSVDIDVSMTPDEMKDQKRADLQDMLVVLAQNAQELGPEAAVKVKEITDMLLEDSAPLVGTIDPSAPVPGPALPPPHVNLTGKLDPAANAAAEQAAQLVSAGQPQ